MMTQIAMCGRYSSGEKLTIRMALAAARDFIFQHRYNICPTQRVPVIVLENGKLVDRVKRWGLVPRWAKDMRGSVPIINVKSETMTEKFHDAATHRRCLVPANGFYEWETTANGKLPWRFVLKNGDPFCFAGIYGQWQPHPTESEPEPSPIETFAILTIEPNALVRKVHNRHPVILHPEHYDWWLGDADNCSEQIEKAFPRGHGQTLHTDTQKFQMALQTYPAEWMEAYRVSKSVNSPKNESPDLLRPVWP